MKEIKRVPVFVKHSVYSYEYDIIFVVTDRL